MFRSFIESFAGLKLHNHEIILYNAITGFDKAFVQCTNENPKIRKRHLVKESKTSKDPSAGVVKCFK